MYDHIRRGASTPFLWGGCDCTTWACDWIAAQTGVDPLERWRGRYASRFGYLRHAVNAGGVEALFSAVMVGLPEIAPDDARCGDAGLVDTPAGPGLALFVGHAWAAKMANGLVRFSSARRAWRIDQCPS